MYQQVRDEEKEAFDSKKMKESKIMLMLDGCMLPDRYLKHCALCPIWILHGGVRVLTLFFYVSLVPPISRNAYSIKKNTHTHTQNTNRYPYD